MVAKAAALVSHWITNGIIWQEFRALVIQAIRPPHGTVAGLKIRELKSSGDLDDTLEKI